MDQYYNKVVDVETRWTDVEVAMKEMGIWHEHNIALDIGCAEGEITRKIAKFCTKVNAFDIDTLKIAHCPVLDNVTFYQADITKFFPAKDKYNIIFYLGVHHKIPNRNDRLNVLDKLFATKAHIIMRAPIEYLTSFVRKSFHHNRHILFYPGNEGQGPISISCLNR